MRTKFVNFFSAKIQLFIDKTKKRNRFQKTCYCQIILHYQKDEDFRQVP